MKVRRESVGCRWESIELSRVFPSAIVTVDAADLHAAGGFFAEERRHQFTAGRLCARAGMARFGAADGPLPAGEDGAPLWPHGIIGSIAHTDRHCGAAVASSAAFLGVGLDIERTRAVRVELWRRLLTAAEVATVERQSPEYRQRHAATLFSAKESFYKCQSAVACRWVDFLDVQIRLREVKREFEVELLTEYLTDQLRGARLHGRFWYGPGVVVTGTVLTA